MQQTMAEVGCGLSCCAKAVGERAGLVGGEAFEEGNCFVGRRRYVGGGLFHEQAGHGGAFERYGKKGQEGVRGACAARRRHRSRAWDPRRVLPRRRPSSPAVPRQQERASAARASMAGSVSSVLMAQGQGATGGVRASAARARRRSRRTSTRPKSGAKAWCLARPGVRRRVPLLAGLRGRLRPARCPRVSYRGCAVCVRGEARGWRGCRPPGCAGQRRPACPVPRRPGSPALWCTWPTAVRARLRSQAKALAGPRDRRRQTAGASCTTVRASSWRPSRASMFARLCRTVAKCGS